MALAPTLLLKARNRAILLTLLDGALRIGELLNAQIADLGGDGILRVYGKGAKQREVTLAPRAITAIN